MENSSNNFVSVIVPVYNDIDRLKLCLDALGNQSYQQMLYEVIVVDNDSTENILHLVNLYSFAVYTLQLQRGSYAARNAGISIARGEILGFTDSDCIPASDWIEKGVKNFLKTPNCGLVAGKINFHFQKPNFPNVFELYDSLNFLKQERYIKDEHYGATANVFTSKEMFSKVGLFDANLKSGGDREWGKRVFAAGYKQVYAEDVCISHPARYSLKEITTKTARVVKGQYISDPLTEQTLAEVLWEFLKDIKPSFKGIFEFLFVKKELKTLSQKLGYVYIYMALRNIRAWTKLKLYFQKC